MDSRFLDKLGNRVSNLDFPGPNQSVVYLHTKTAEWIDNRNRSILEERCIYSRSHNQPTVIFKSYQQEISRFTK